MVSRYLSERETEEAAETKVATSGATISVKSHVMWLPLIHEQCQQDNIYSTLPNVYHSLAVPTSTITRFDQTVKSTTLTTYPTSLNLQDMSQG